MALSAEKKKQIAVAVLFPVALCAVIWSLLFSDDSGSSSTSSTKQSTPKPGIRSAVNPIGQTDTKPANNVILVSQPLELGGLWDSTSPVIGRNIFVYPPPPTPRPIVIKETPTPPPPPPPPITLAGLNPSQVTARTADFQMVVFGAKIPADARVMINGSPYPTTVVSDSQLKVNVPASVIANPGQVQIEVKGADPVTSYSNRLALNISPPPIPGFKYLGLIVKNGVSTAVLRDEAESELRNVRVGTKLGTRWQVTNITQTEIEILDITINVRHRLPFSGENG